MIRNGIPARWSPFFILATVTTVLAAGPTFAQSKPATYEGNAVRIGHGTAHTVVRTDTKGDLASIGIVFTPGMPAGYIVPPGTAVSQMGVHAVNPSAPEFHNQPPLRRHRQEIGEIRVGILGRFWQSVKHDYWRVGMVPGLMIGCL